jgi:hypothetical protein
MVAGEVGRKLVTSGEIRIGNISTDPKLISLYIISRGRSNGREKQERWIELAEQITQEKDLAKLIELTRELNKALADRDLNENRKIQGAA